MAIGSVVVNTACQDPEGHIVASGFLKLTLSQAATITSNGLVPPTDVSVQLNSSGVTAASQNLWLNDQLSPTGTTYRMKLFDSVGNFLADFGNVSITGTSPVDLSTIIATSTGVSFPAPVLLNTTTLQTMAGPLSAANTAAGNLAMKAASTDGVIYLTSNGSDSNDGLSWGSAKGTLAGSLSTLPSTGGTIYFTGTIALNTAPTLKSNVNIIGSGDAQIDSVTGPATFTTTLTSGDLFYINTLNDCLLSNFSIKNTAGSGANAAIRLTAAQRNKVDRVYISGAFARGVQLDSSSTAGASCIWNSFFDVHTTGMAANGIGLLLDSTNASSKVINGNFFYNFRATGGATGASACGIKLTNSGVHNQVINENVFWASEAVATAGTAILVDQGSTRGCVFIDCDAEGSVTGLSKATANTLTFLGGNISSNSGTNVSDSQPIFTQLIGTNVGGTVQTFGITPAGGVYVDGLSVGGAAPVTNQITGTTGWQIAASGTAVATVNNTSFELAQNLIFDAGKKLTQYNGVATAGNGIPAIFGSTSQKSESAADTNVLTFTPPAAVGVYRVNFVLSLSAANTATLGWTATWKDSNGNAQSPTNLALFQSGTAAPALTFVTSAAGNYYGDAIVDVDNSATGIVVKLTFSGTSFAGKASATVERMI